MSTGAHVLVVDDDEDILKLLTMRLRAKGFRITAVGSAEQALTQIAIDPPRVVVSDIRLPGQDGLALFEEIRRTRPTLPVILLTAHGNIPDAVDATSRGVFGYLTKPFDSQILLEKSTAPCNSRRHPRHPVTISVSLASVATMRGWLASSFAVAAWPN